jgi:hypothetical protein
MYRPLLDKYKTTKEIDKAFKVLKTIKSKNYEAIKTAYFKLFPIYPIPTIPVETKILEEVLSVYRTRPFSNNIDPRQKKTFSFPDVSDYSETQRANWKGRNVFYAGDSFYTSLSETKLMYGEKKFYVSKWGFNFKDLTSKQILIVPLGFSQFSENNPWKKVLNSEVNLKKHLLRTNSKKDTELIYYFFEKIGELFSSQNEDNYHISAFLADQILYQSKSIQKRELYFPILLYPSVENDKNSCNFAISPFFVSKYMSLEKVFKIKINGISSNKIQFNYNEMGIEKSETTIEWYSIDYEKEKSYYQFKSIACQCGKKFDIDNVDNYRFIKDGKEYGHQDIMAKLTKEIDLINDLDENLIIEEKDILGGLMADFRHQTDDIKLEVDGTVHENLQFEFKFITPFVYQKLE